nr:hypothetical protein [Tanacetum cinerariifolium]
MEEKENLSFSCSTRNRIGAEDKLNYPELSIPTALVPVVVGQPVPLKTLAAHAAWVKRQKEIVVLMIMTMEPDLQWNLETVGVYDMLKELKTLFSQQAEQELLQTVRVSRLQARRRTICKLVILKMKSYIDNSKRLGHLVSLSLAVSLILVFVRKEYDSFVQNYNMHGMRKTKKNKNKKPQLAAKGNNKGKGKSKLAYAPKPKIPPSLKKEDPAKDSVCHHCHDTSHGKRNCTQCLSKLLKNKKLPQGASTSDTIRSMVWESPKLSYLKVWGCEALVKRDTLTKPDKLEPRYIKCIFVGYPKKIMGYSFYYPPENVFVAQNDEFFENSLITQEAIESLKDLELIQEKDTHPFKNTSSHHDEGDQEISDPQSDIIPIRRSTRTRHAPDQMCLNIEDDEYELGDLNEPANYRAALLDPESDKWLNDMNVETQSMRDNEVWDLDDLHANGKTIDSKWLFKKKTDMDESIHTYKARLVEKGYTQTPRIGYEETFSPVAKIRAIRILIAIAASIPVQEKLKLSKSQGASTPVKVKCMQNVPYASAVGSIMYAVRCTRPDVAFAQNITSRFQQNPAELHQTAVKNILKYLRNTKDMFLVYEDDIKRELRGEVPTIKEPIKMYCDNTGAITIANASRITKGPWMLKGLRAEDYAFRLVLNLCILFIMGSITDMKSVLTQKALTIFCETYHIPDAVHPQLPSPNQTIHEMPSGKIGVLGSLSMPIFDYRFLPYLLTLLESTVGRVFPLLPVAPSRASSELEASVDKLFDKGASGDGQGTDIQPVIATTDTIVEDVAPLQPRRQRKRKTVVADVSGPSNPPKKLKEDYGAVGGASTAGKSRSVVQSLFTEAVLNAEARGEPIPTLPFVTSSVSATPKHEDKSPADSVTGLNLRTIGSSQRFVISSDSSHHSGTNIAEAEVDAIVMSSASAIATVTTVTAAVNADTTADRVPVEPSLFGVGSSSTGRADSVPGGFSNVSGSDFLIGEKKIRLRTVVDEQAELLKVRDREIESLKTQLLLKESEAAEAISLRAEVFKFEAT